MMKGVLLNKISFDFKLMKWRGITIEQMQLWERLYPEVDVVQQLKVDMIAWLDRKKDTKLSHKKDWKRTIHNWLKKEQERNIGR